jgi:hypothetical protein
MRGFKVSASDAVLDVQAREQALALVNRYALKPQRSDDVAIFEAEAANELIDRDTEAFSTEILTDFAETLPGKSLLVGHEWGPVGVGRIIAARLDDEEGYQRLLATFFVLKQTDADLITKLEAGVAWAVSIGFYAPQRKAYVLDDGRTVSIYERGPAGEKGEAIELSLVFLGAQYNAEVTGMKAAGGKDPRCGRDVDACQHEVDVLRRELWTVKRLQDRARYDRPGLPRRTDLDLVSLDRKRVELVERLAASCRGGI